MKVKIDSMTQIRRFPVSVLTNATYQLVSTIEVYCLTVLEARSPKPRCQQSCFSLQEKSSGYEGELVPCISPGLWCFA